MMVGKINSVAGDRAALAADRPFPASVQRSKREGRGVRGEQAARLSFRLFSDSFGYRLASPILVPHRFEAVHRLSLTFPFTSPSQSGAPIHELFLHRLGRQWRVAAAPPWASARCRCAR